MILHRSAATTAARRKPRRRESYNCNFPVTVVRVHPDVLAVALELAEGDPRRLRVESPTAILVANGVRR